MKTTVIKTIEFLKSPRGQSIRYLFIGGCTTLLDYLAYTLMIKLFHIDITVSNIISTVLAILFAYVTNKYLVFISRTSTFSELVLEFLKFIAARLSTIGIELGGVYLLVNKLGQDYRLGKVATIALVIIANYFLSKFLVFREKPDTKTP